MKGDNTLRTSCGVSTPLQVREGMSSPNHGAEGEYNSGIRIAEGLRTVEEQLDLEVFL